MVSLSYLKSSLSKYDPVSLQNYISDWKSICCNAPQLDKVPLESKNRLLAHIELTNLLFCEEDVNSGNVSCE